MTNQAVAGAEAQMQRQGREPTATKRGPGRRHVSGHKKLKQRSKSGAGFGFVAHTNPRKNAQRAVKAEIGARQYRMQRKALRRAALESA